MNTINNKTIVFNISLLALLAVSILAPAKIASAQYYGNQAPVPIHGYYSDQDYQNNITYIPAPAPTYTYYPPAPTPIPAPAPTPTIYSNTENPNQVSTPKPKVVAKPKPAEPETLTNNDLAANAIFGSNTFLPSGIIQWILFAILVFLIVILVRKIYGGGEKYHAAPMKHK